MKCARNLVNKMQTVSFNNFRSSWSEKENIHRQSNQPLRIWAYVYTIWAYFNGLPNFLLHFWQLFPAPDQLWLAPNELFKIPLCPCLLYFEKYCMVRQRKFIVVWRLALSCKREGYIHCCARTFSVSFICQVNEVSNPFSVVFGFCSSSAGPGYRNPEVYFFHYGC